jgi:hypothetical protein
MTSNNGDTWIPKNSGLNYFDISDLAITGDSIYAATGDGVYRAKITNLITSVEDMNPKIENIIYPNPASDFLNIYTANLIGKGIRIYDMLGNKLITVIAESTETKINIETLPIGVYIIRFGVQTQMFVKE